MFMLLLCSGPPQQPSGCWSARRNLMPRSLADLISSGFGGVMGAGLGPSVASGERWGFFLVVAESAGFLSVLVSVIAALMGAAAIAAHAMSATAVKRRGIVARVRIGFLDPS